MRPYLIILLAPLTFLSACATSPRTSPLSFAPPFVDTEDHIGDGQRKSLLTGLSLINKFTASYRKAASANANGRQAFEVPSFLATVGAVTATAFGAGPNVVLAGGGANAVFKGGNAYYSPKTKAAIYNSAIEALQCVKSVAKDVEPLTAQDRPLVGDDNGELIYDVLYDASVDVETILKRRLSDVSSMESLDKLLKDYQNAVNQADEARNAVNQIQPNKNFDFSAFKSDSNKMAQARDAYLQELRKKINVCVVRART